MWLRIRIVALWLGIAAYYYAEFRYGAKWCYVQPDWDWTRIWNSSNE